MFIIVDLPEPDGPMIATSSPSWMSRSTPRRACTVTSPIDVRLGDPAQSEHGLPAGSHSPAGSGPASGATEAAADRRRRYATAEPAAAARPDRRRAVPGTITVSPSRGRW